MVVAAPAAVVKNPAAVIKKSKIVKSKNPSAAQKLKGKHSKQWALLTRKQVRIATECSGIETPVVALKSLLKDQDIEVKHVSATEKDKAARKVIIENQMPDVLIIDINKREIEQMPDMDIYVAGPPCQDYSLAGSMAGDASERGMIIFKCVKAIIEKKPMVAILENVIWDEVTLPRRCAADPGNAARGRIFSICAGVGHAELWPATKSQAALLRVHLAVHGTDAF